MKVIGITGGVGSGKSQVLSYLEEKLGATICQADHVAWRLQEPGQICYQKIVSIFGTDILDENECIDRKKLGKIVFNDSDKLVQLNGIMHPAVKESIINEISALRRQNTEYFFVEAALLIENGYKNICDELWYIYVEESIRRKRLKDSRAYTDEKIDAIMSKQLSEQEFRKHCQIIIDNSGDFEDTCNQIEKRLNL